MFKSIYLILIFSSFSLNCSVNQPPVISFTVTIFKKNAVDKNGFQKESVIQAQTVWSQEILFVKQTYFVNKIKKKTKLIDEYDLNHTNEKFLKENEEIYTALKENLKKVKEHALNKKIAGTFKYIFGPNKGLFEDFGLHSKQIELKKIA